MSAAPAGRPVERNQRALAKKIVILGAGPTGLGAAYRLRETGHENFVVLEARGSAGGLASSETSANGFIYDIGGHVLFSHFRYFDELFDRMLGDEYQELQREAWVWMMDRFLPYPFQNNIKDLPARGGPEVRARRDRGAEGASASGKKTYETFEEMIFGVFGKGIAEYFMMPYNFKVWAHPPKMLGTHWIGERVPVVDLERMITNVLLDRPDVSWGPNNTFKYPRHGGTGGMFLRVASTLEDRIRYGAQAVGLDVRRKRVLLADGTDEGYDQLISTVPVDKLVQSIPGRALGRSRGDEAPASLRAARSSESASRSPRPTTKCWMYFPEENCPYYRVTYLSNYSPEVVPDATRQYSLLAEVSRSPYKPVEPRHGRRGGGGRLREHEAPLARRTARTSSTRT